MDKRQEALVVTAKAYLARGVYLQYDDTRAVTGNVVEPPVYRWQRHKNGPEDSTRQHTCYTNCAAFTYDVYKQAFDLDIKNWCTEMLIADGLQQAFKYEVQFNETDEQKELVEKAYIGALQPGDIIVDRHVKGGGHAMLYVGDGKIIHSSAPGGGNYDYKNKCDKYEPNGSINCIDVKELFTPGMRRYTFTEEFNIAIVRPLQVFKDAKITESTQARMDYLQDIFVEKLCSHTVGQCVDLGEEVTFTYYIRNDREESAHICISDIIPEYTEYVSGGKFGTDGRVAWSEDIEAKGERYFSYTVKVKNDENARFKYVESLEGKVCGVKIKCPAVQIASHLDKDVAEKMSAEAKKLQGSNLAGIDLAKELYKQAGAQLDLASAEDILADLFVPHKRSKSHFELNSDSCCYKMVIPTMYGGYYTATCNDFGGVRTAGVFDYEIMSGDILICTENADNSGAKVFAFAGDCLLTSGENGAEVIQGEDCANVLMSMPGYYKFAVLRPSMRK